MTTEHRAMLNIMTRAKRAAIALVAVSTLPAPGLPATPSETVGALLLRQQEQSAAPFIQHCNAKAPELRRPLEGEYSRFRKKFLKATASLRSGIKANAELSKPAPRELIAQFEQMNRESLAQSKALDPRSFCTALRSNLSQATEKSIQENMQSAFAQYTALARQSR
jgi:hypothetical protein